MIIEDKDGKKYLIWSIDRERILETNKVKCDYTICGKRSCGECILELEDVDLSEFRVLDYE